MEPKLQTNTAAFQEGLEFGRPFSLTKLALMCSVYRAFLCFLRQAVAMQAGDFTNAINVYTEAMGGTLEDVWDVLSHSSPAKACQGHQGLRAISSLFMIHHSL